MLVDSHCHLDCLDLTPYSGDLSKALVAAKQNDVEFILCVCINLEDFPNMMKVIEPFENVCASVGVHPNEDQNKHFSEELLLELAEHPSIVAIGETGLDYYRSKGDVEWQRERFRTHIKVAKQLYKPLIIHTREAREDTINIMREEDAGSIGGVMHCFTETWEMAQQAIELGFHISFSGIVTFNSAKELQEVAKKVPLDKILIETDAPYLAPVPYRGKSNEPAYVKHVAEKIAELRGISYEAVAEQTTKNFYDLFKQTAYMHAR